MRAIIFVFLLGFTNYTFGQLDFTKWDAFLKKHVNASGDVHYKAIKADIKSIDLITNELSAKKVSSSASKNDQLAYWINVYNAYTVKLIADNYPISSIQKLDGGKPWDVKRITIEGSKYSLNQIENDIIRATFKDARIHFAVNCGAKSCPPLLNGAYFGKTLDTQLESQTKKFVNNTKYQSIKASQVNISKIFEWYGADFGNIIVFLNKYSQTKIDANATIKFQEYDWSLNDQK